MAQKEWVAVSLEVPFEFLELSKDSQRTRAEKATVQREPNGRLHLLDLFHHDRVLVPFDAADMSLVLLQSGHLYVTVTEVSGTANVLLPWVSILLQDAWESSYGRFGDDPLSGTKASCPLVAQLLLVIDVDVAVYHSPRLTELPASQYRLPFEVSLIQTGNVTGGKQRKTRSIFVGERYLSPSSLALTMARRTLKSFAAHLRLHPGFSRQGSIWIVCRSDSRRHERTEVSSKASGQTSRSTPNKPSHCQKHTRSLLLRFTSIPRKEKNLTSRKYSLQTHPHIRE